MAITDFAALRASAQDEARERAQAQPPASGPSKPRRGKKRSSKQKHRRGRRIVNVLLGIFIVAAMAAAAVLGWKAMQPPESVEAPLPQKTFENVVSDTVTGSVDTAVLPDGTEMKPDWMEPGTMFIPALEAYTPIDQSESFVDSKYAGFTSLQIPDDPKRSVWYSGGAGLYGGDTGATMVASHVSAWGEWGVLRYLYSLQGGEMIYTKDYEGNLQSWQVTGMRVEHHTEFPQEYWSPEGERYLVVTTCGGTLTPYGTYQDNIFVVAHPVDPVPRTPEQIAADEAVAKKKADEEAAAKQAAEQEAAERLQDDTVAESVEVGA